MNSVHLVTQEKNESKRIENGPSAPSTLPKASPRAQLPGRAPAAQPAQPRARPRLLPLACRARLRPCQRPPAACSLCAPPRPSAQRPRAPSAQRLAPQRSARPACAPARPARLAQRPASSLMGSSPFQGLQQIFFFFSLK